MPSPDIVLAGLTLIANDWRWLAITWHVVFGAWLIALFAGWRPSVRLSAGAFVIPLLSVSVTAWLSGNPFNGVVFAVLAALLGAIAVRLPDRAVRFAPFGWVVPGVAFVLFGATYPHFVRVESWTMYFYASPFGLLPCPTLSGLIGGTLIFSNFRCTSWSMPLALTGLLYGAVGVFRLGVAVDLGLLLAAGVLGAAVAADGGRRSIGNFAAALGRT
jgi:hypothetical protein